MTSTGLLAVPFAPGSTPTDFIWATGIENTFVPQTRPGHRALDEYQLMGHYTHWREDLALVRELGMSMVRWGVPWYRVEPLPGEFDWRWTDQVIPYLVQDLGITPIIDLMHYGCPFWLRREFAGDEYPQAVATYAAAFAERYRSLVRWYTPLNEPIVNALMCGKRGVWPPYLHGDGGYIKIMLQIAKGIIRTVEAIKAIDSNAIMVHVEATGLSQAAREDLASLAIEEQRRGFLCYDLVTGQVRPDHPLFLWLVQNGARPDDLAALARQKISLDILGLNFYPQWSMQHISIDRKGRVTYTPNPDGASGFADMITDYYQRYQVPIMITETSAAGSDEVRARWLSESIESIKQLRSQAGIPLIGYTWFPLFTMIDWRYRFGREPLERYRLELGLYRLSDGDTPRWQRTALVEQIQRYIAAPESAIGTLMPR